MGRTEDAGSFISRTVLYLSWQVYVPDIKQASIHVVVEGLFTAHQFILMCQVDLMDRLPLFYQRHQDFIESGDFPFRSKDPASGFRYLIRCPPLGSQSIVNSFCQRTLLYFTASVAYIWRFKAMGTYFFFIMLAVTVAYEFTLFTDSYQWMPAVICPTYFFPLTCFSVLAGIMRSRLLHFRRSAFSSPQTAGCAFCESFLCGGNRHRPQAM